MKRGAFVERASHTHQHDFTLRSVFELSAHAIANYAEHMRSGGAQQQEERGGGAGAGGDPTWRWLFDDASHRSSNTDQLKRHLISIGPTRRRG